MIVVIARSDRDEAIQLLLAKRRKRVTI